MLLRTPPRPPPAAAGRRAPTSSPARPARGRAAAAIIPAVCGSVGAAPAAAARGAHPPRRRRRRGAPAPLNSAASAQAAEAVCYTGTVTWDNDASEDCTVLAIESPEYDGLLRVIAWVLYGLHLRVRAAVLRSSTAAEDEASSLDEGEGALDRGLGAAGSGAAAGGASSRVDSALGRALAGGGLGGSSGGNGSSSGSSSGGSGGGSGGGGASAGVGGGSVTDVFWVTDRRGRKLSDKSADGVAERLQEFISTCAPDEDTGARFEAGLQGWECPGGGLHATNGSHADYTQLTVTADDYSPGLVLEMTSVIAGMGVAVREAVVRSGGTRLGGHGGGGGSGAFDDGGGGGGGGNGASAAAAAAPRPAAPPSPPLGMAPSMAAEITRALESLPEPPPGKRVLRFWLYDKTKGGGGGAGAGAGAGKLSFEQVQALLYCIGLATGKGNLTTSPPNKTITGCACSPVPPVVAASSAVGASAGGSASASASSQGDSTVAWTTGDESS